MQDVLRASQVRGLQEKENIAAGKHCFEHKQSPHEPAVKNEMKGEKKNADIQS